MVFEMDIDSADYIKYPSGELQVRLRDYQLKEVQEATQIHVLATRHQYGGDFLLSLALLTDALKHHNGHQADFTLFLPYLPFGRADRRFVTGDCCGLQVFSKILGQLGYNQVVTFDAHSKVSEFYFDNLVNVRPTKTIKGIAERLFESHGEGTIILPDEGAKRYNLDTLGFPVVQCEKVRDAKTGKLSGFKVPKIETYKALIVDDICDGGGTFIGISNEVVQQPDRHQLSLYVSHGIFSKGLFDLGERFQNIYTTDSMVRSINAHRFNYEANQVEPMVKRIPCIPILKEEMKRYGY